MAGSFRGLLRRATFWLKTGNWFTRDHMKSLAQLMQNADIVFVPLSPLLAPAFDKIFQIGQQKDQKKASKPKKGPFGIKTATGAGTGALIGGALAAPTGGLSIGAGAAIGAGAGGLFGAGTEDYS